MYYELSALLVLIIITFRSFDQDNEEFILSKKHSERVNKLWDIAHTSMKNNRFIRAEKALLTILKIDEKNAQAYNRLGILYAKQREYKDAIDCFEIASSIEANASALHNLGLIYFETENYSKAAVALEQALKLDYNLANRHVAYAKVQEKLNNHNLMIEELNKAFEIEPSIETGRLLIEAYEKNNHPIEADQIKDRIKQMTPKKLKRRMLRPKRRVII